MAPALHITRTKHDDVVDVIKEYKDWYEKKENIQKIKNVCEDTLKWLENNKQSYEHNHHLTREPWWPELEPSDSPMLIETRKTALRYRIYEHGMIRTLNSLSDRGVISEPYIPDATLNTILDATTHPVLNQLIAYRYAASPIMKNKTDSLSDLKKKFGFADTTKTKQLRNNFLIRLTSVGLLSAHYNGQYAISIGPVGEIFFASVYLPCIEKYSNKL